MVDPATETSVEQLQKFGVLAKRQIKLLHEELEKLTAELDALKGQEPGTELQRRIEGLEALLNEANAAGGDRDDDTSTSEADVEEEDDEDDYQPGHGPTPQPDLRTHEVFFELDEADKTCPKCGDDLQPMSGQYETSEMVDVIEVEYVIKQVHCQKYHCDCGHIEAALGPDRTRDGGRYSLDFGVHAAAQKFLDHLPIERQVRMMRRAGLLIRNSTMWDQVHAIAEYLEPTYQALWNQIYAQDVIGVDQTSWKNLSKRPKTNWKVWSTTSIDAVVFSIRKTQKKKDFIDLFEDFEGVIVMDAAPQNIHGARGSPNVTPACCWAHVVRKFKGVTDDFPVAEEFLELCGKMYEYERKTADDRAARAAIRQEKTKPLVDEMKEWLFGCQVLQSTSLGKAIKYALTYWDELTRFVDDPDIWIDNNRTERSIRGPVVGRKNFYGSKSLRGTRVAAMIYSIVETAKMRGLPADEYLHAVAHYTKHNPGRPLLPDEFAARQ